MKIGNIEYIESFQCISDFIDDIQEDNSFQGSINIFISNHHHFRSMSEIIGRLMNYYSFNNLSDKSLDFERKYFKRNSKMIDSLSFKRFGLHEYLKKINHTISINSRYGTIGVVDSMVPTFDKAAIKFNNIKNRFPNSKV